MAGLVEAAVERAREEQEVSNQKTCSQPNKRNAGETFQPGKGILDTPRSVKKARFSPPPPSGPVVIESQNLPLTSAPTKGKAKSKKTHIHAYPDAVAEGYVSEEEGKGLLQMQVKM